MDAAVRWIRRLSLKPHPEGGYYCETYRSDARMPGNESSVGFAAGYNLCTAIYFLLQQGDFSAFHRISSDELWHSYDGDGVALSCAFPQHRNLIRRLTRSAPGITAKRSGDGR